LIVEIGVYLLFLRESFFQLDVINQKPKVEKQFFALAVSYRHCTVSRLFSLFLFTRE